MWRDEKEEEEKEEQDHIISSEAWRASASLGSCRAALR